MRLSITVPILALTLLMTSCDSPLQKAKEDAITKLSENNPLILKEVVLEHMDLESNDPGTEAIEVDGGTFFVLSPTSREKHERGTALEYPGVSAIIMNNAGGSEFSALPSAWGEDDLAKSRTVYSASRRAIDEASDHDQLKEAVAMLTARATMAPASVFDRLIWLENDRLEGLLSGDHSHSNWMELFIRPANAAETNYLIHFRRKEGGSYDHVLQFIRSLAFEPNAGNGDRLATDTEAQDEESPKP